MIYGSTVYSTVAVVRDCIHGPPSPLDQKFVSDANKSNQIVMDGTVGSFKVSAACHRYDSIECVDAIAMDLRTIR